LVAESKAITAASRAGGENEFKQTLTEFFEFFEKNKNYFNLIDFDNLEVDKFENLNDKQIFTQVKILSYRAINGSFLFCDILANYIK
jgi:hypothetical protein